MSLCLVELLTKTTPNTDGRAMLSVLRNFKLKKRFVSKLSLTYACIF